MNKVVILIVIIKTFLGCSRFNKRIEQKIKQKEESSYIEKFSYLMFVNFSAEKTFSKLKHDLLENYKI